MVDLNNLPHGGALDVIKAAFADAPQPWIDLSTGINPHAYGPLSLSGEALAHLPTQAQSEQLQKAMAPAWGANAAAIYPVAGSELLIRQLPQLVGGQCVGLAPFSYADHEQAWRAAGADIVHSEDAHALAHEVDVLVLVNPNNPTGRLYTADELRVLYQRLQAKGGSLIVDEAYMDLTPEHSLSPLAGAPGLIILRSTGKFYGLAGLRLGALLADEAVGRRWQAISGHWSVSSLALELGAQVYGDEQWADAMREQLQQQAADFSQQLTDAGVELVGGTALFFLVRVEDARASWRQLARAGIYVRCWPQHADLLRIGLPANDQQAARLLRSLDGAS